MALAHFQFDYAVTGINRVPPEGRSFQMKEFRLALSELETKSDATPASKSAVRCVVSMTRELPAEIEQGLRDTIAGKFSLKTEQLKIMPARNGSESLVFKNHPEQLLSWCDALTVEIQTSVKKFIRLLRWRYDTTGSSNPIQAALQKGFSFDQVNWHGLPGAIVAEIEMQRDMDWQSFELEHVKSLFSADAFEPIGHDLCREAWELRLHNRRASFLIAVAAIEVGFKQFAIRLLPSTDWLLINVQSPFIHKMLKDWLPTMPVKNRIGGKAFVAPTHLKVIQAAAEERNRITHRGEDVDNPIDIRSLLEIAMDLLWLLDFYSGHNWAWNHVRESTRVELERFAAKGL